MSKTKQKKSMPPEALSLVAQRFKILGEPARLALLNALMQDEMNVTDLCAATGMAQANVSKHLGMLLRAGFVQRRKDGLRALYSIADSSVWQLCDLMCSSVAQKLDHDRNAFR